MTQLYNRTKPPQWADKFLRWYCSAELLEEIQGDLYEAFDYRTKHIGAKKARWHFVLDVFKFFRPYSFKRTRVKNLNNLAMIKNYFKVAYRNLRKDYFYSSINVFGLAIGIAITLLIARFIQYELSFDKFHTNYENTYRIIRDRKVNDFETGTNTASPYLIGELAKTDMPDVVFGRIAPHSGLTVAAEKKFVENDILMVDENIFKIFDFEFVAGNPANDFHQPNLAILTKDIATKYFEEEDPIGKFISVRDQTYSVVGIVKRMPQNSHFHFDFLLSFETNRKFRSASSFEHPGNLWMYTYAMAPEGFGAEEIDYNLSKVYEKWAGDNPFAKNTTYYTQPLADIHLKTKTDGGDIGTNGSLLIVQGSAVSALIILLIACFNFMNLATARSTKKVKEVSVRKAVGAYRKNLIVQFLLESVLVTALACVIAVALAQLIAPFFNKVLGRELPLGFSNLQTELFWIVAGGAVISLLAGSYPAIYLSRFSPSSLMTSHGGKSAGMSAAIVRKGLVILQFTASIILIAATLIIYKQLNFIQAKELGFNKENVLVLSITNSQASEKKQFLKNEISRLPNVISTSLASNVPGDGLNSWRVESLDPDKKAQTSLHVMVFDYDYLQTLNLDLVAGRNFSRDFASDSLEAILLNQSAVELLGLEDPIGAEFSLNGQNEVKVIGVVKDFHSGSLYEEINPLLFKMEDSWYWKVTARVEPGNLQETIASIEKIWKGQVSDWPFNISFLDDRLARQYESDIRLGQSFVYFSVLAIFIACLGLFGLSSFATEQRFKEIGIRKALGAGTGDILPLIFKQFAVLLLISFLLAIPASWYMMDTWLQNFVFHAEIGPMIFVMAGILSILVAAITIGYHSMRAARANPVDSLRYE